MTHEISKIDNYSVYRRLGNTDIYYTTVSILSNCFDYTKIGHEINVQYNTPEYEQVHFVTPCVNYYPQVGHAKIAKRLQAI